MGNQDLKNQFNLHTFVLVFSKEQQIGKNKKRCTLKGENKTWASSAHSDP